MITMWDVSFIVEPSNQTQFAKFRIDERARAEKKRTEFAFNLFFRIVYAAQKMICCVNAFESEVGER